jgi:muramoyltetrapeptide carboxypeptidase
VAVAAPAAPFDPDRFQSGVEAIRGMGFQVVMPEEIHSRHGFLAGSDRQRSELVHRFFTDPSVDAVVCARGGWGSMRILPLLDFESLAQKPKIFVGFSDVSALLWALHRRSSLTVFHGPMVLSLAEAEASTRRAFHRALCGAQPVEIAAEPRTVLQAGRCRGTVVCGNLTTLCHLVGTPFAPALNGCILMLEDTGEAPYRIDRMLTHMTMAGCFRGLRGLALGSFAGCGDPAEVRRVFAEHFADREIPMLAGFPVGHDEPNLTVPVGEGAVLDTESGTLRFERPATVVGSEGGKA